MRLLILLLAFILSGCQQKQLIEQKEISPPLIKKNPTNKPFPPKKVVLSKATTHDGEPSGPKPTKFQKVTPVYEPYSRYGNPESYAVDGQNYQVMRTASGYKTRGIASWYGTKFHNKRTSSGDEYDMYAMTAAHKTLPLPSYVRVKNLSNGREAIVKVNDRGPFHSDRVLDLSYAAATKLGLLPKGTAPVEVEALVTGGAHIAHYYVQAGAFSTQQYANVLQQKLAKMSTSPVFIEQYQQHYIVKVGPFAEKKMSDHLKQQLALNGVQGSFSMLQ